MSHLISHVQGGKALKPSRRSSAQGIVCSGDPANLIEDTRDAWLLDELADRPGVEIALDTEFQDTTTLSIQAATRIDKDIFVQVYHSDVVPPPQSFQVSNYVPRQQYGKFCRRIFLRPFLPITTELSLAQILMDLVGIYSPRTRDRTSGARIAHDQGAWFMQSVKAHWDEARGEWKLPTIRVHMIGHFLPADLGRVFGAEFSKSLFQPDQRGSQPLTLQDRKLLTITHPQQRFAAPTVEFIDSPEGFYRVVLETRDTRLPFGSASLERHCQTFLGFGKCAALSDNEKGNMLETFLARPSDAFGYAIVDSVNTLLLHEQMKEKHERVYRSFGFHDDIPKFQPTMGSRVSRFLLETLKRQCEQSHILSRSRNLKRLLRQGGRGLFNDDPRASRYGSQTGGTHGGLLFSRSPTCFCHKAQGQLRDIDMSGCYPRIISEQNLYCGRPVIHEPGDNRLSLKDAVGFAEANAAPDAWMIRTTGDLPTGLNSLILSTLDARTTETLRRRIPIRDPNKQSTKLFSARVESGIVTQATWSVIQALPEPLRSEYHALTAETIILYPRILVATTAAEYDQLAGRFQHENLGFDSHMDFGGLRKIDVTRLDDAYVALRFPIKDLARRFVDLRQDAKDKFGKGSGLERAWKEQANTMYGVLASKHLSTQNFLAANIITSTARANAWVISLALNGIQVITDGASYRRDQIPACTFGECLCRCPDYPLRRPEADEIPFLDPSEVPEENSAFTLWFQARAKWFFEDTHEDFAKLVSIPILEHKLTGTTGSAAFDALMCDGAGNYVKCTYGNEGCKIHEAAMRGYGSKCREPILQWILATYRTDRIESPCPIVEDKELLKLEKALAVARRALQAGYPEVYLPLGLEHQKPLAYGGIKPSAFIFRTPKQCKKLTRQVERFQKKTTCGLELLCLRRKQGKKPRKLSDQATQIYEYIQTDGQDLTKKFNLHRLLGRHAKIAKRRTREMARRRRQSELDLRARIDTRRLSPEAKTTGIYVTAESELLAR